jgi:membrane-associated protease RseP (regulator of RpoE activity)
MGGAALIADHYRKYWHMSYVVLAGPLVGAMLAVGFYATYLITGSTFIGVAAYWIAFLNLFNLLPLAMLDGGQLIEAVMYSINDYAATIFLTGSYVIGAVILWHFNPTIALFMVFMGFQAITAAWKELQLKRQGLPGRMYHPQRMNGIQIVYSLLGYVGTAGLLMLLIHLCQSNSLQVESLFSRHS